MTGEIIFKTAKPESKEEILQFRQFKLELKNLLKTGKSKTKVLEKFKDFTFIITDYTTAEKQSIAAFIKDNKTVGIID